MTETFEVGQKVAHETRGEVEVAYGPYKSTWGAKRYVVRLSNGTEVPTAADVLAFIPESPKFAVGDTVKLTTRGSLATVEYGPFDGRDVYVVRLVEEPTDPHDVRTFTALASVMAHAPEPIKVGDRVRILHAKHAEEYHGKVGTVVSAREVWTPRGDVPHTYSVAVEGRPGSLYVARLERVTEPVPAPATYVYNDVSYELGVTYSDNDGDRWTFARHEDEIPMSTAGSFCRGSKLSDVVDDFGPLTRV
ncbi:phiSA1p31-related protein [Streptomyces sp. NPDC060001]|uniref:phiSA1p31-related protein n=1 Tax=Streptomyces sp. NPDC060001 TaxID=3347032 RepID=UPI0036935B3B